MNPFLTPSILIALFCSVFLIDTVVDFLNLEASKKPLPASLKDVQTEEMKLRASNYLEKRVYLGATRSVFLLVSFLVLLGRGFFRSLQNFSEHCSDKPMLQAIIFTLSLVLLNQIAQIPFSAYSTFVIEEEFGFNRTTPKIFISDLMKSLFVGLLLGGTLFSFIVSILMHSGANAGWIIWLGYTAFQFFLVWIAPVTLLPLFLKLSPITEGPLKTAIESYAKKQSFSLDGAWICDASKRSAKSNAFFTGFGRFRRLVLFDTLIEKHPESEIIAIVAHEAGHFKLGHIWKHSLATTLASLVVFLAIQKLVEADSLYSAFLVRPGNVGIGLILALMVLSKLSFFLSPIGAYFSRRNEYAADQFSVETTGDAASMVSGLKRLVTDNLGVLQNHPLHVILHASHPPLVDRIKPLV